MEVRLEEESVWLTQAQMVELFQSSKQNISLHINNIYKEKELAFDSTVKEYLTVQKEGNRNVSRLMKYYNLDVIISVGYRVKSLRGTQFRIWANQVLKNYLLKGYAVNQRVDRIENDVHTVKKELGEIKLQLNTSLPANQGIFYDGQTFDAYAFVSGLIKSAKKSIILIDNYIDESVLTLLSKRNKTVDAFIYTKTISKQLKLDIKKHNQQYPKIDLKSFEKSHDRFLIIDKETVYHIGASLKDLGKRCLPAGQAGFAFSKMNMDSLELINKLDGNAKP
ncbi:MAG: virulence RhuM family protein [Bacteroidales bacterium]